MPLGSGVASIACLLLIIGADPLALHAAEPVPAPAAGQAAAPEWPPVIGKRYPDLTLKNHKGEPVALSSFAGKILLIEPIGMNCPACNAFVGGLDPAIGGYSGTIPQAGLMAAPEMLTSYAKVDIDDPRVVYVHLLLYSMTMHAPTVDDAKAWAEHFKTEAHPNHVVLIGGDALVNSASYHMIPGFQLVDGSFTLVSDSSGHAPHDDLYRVLLPKLGTLLAEKAKAPASAKAEAAQPKAPGRTSTSPAAKP